MLKALANKLCVGRLFASVGRAAVAGLVSVWIVGCAPLPVSESALQLNQQLLAGIDSCVAGNQTLVQEVGKQRALIESQTSQIVALTDAQRASESTQFDNSLGDAGCASQDKGIAQKQVVGQLEKVWMPNLNLALTGRIDTGAETSSLDARSIELFERDGKRWVRFEIENPKAGKPPIQLERKLSRIVSIVQSNSPEAERRPVIKLAVTIGDVNQTAEFTLSNRSHLDYQVLIGRNILQDVMIVDVSRKNIAPFLKTESEVATAGAN